MDPTSALAGLLSVPFLVLCVVIGLLVSVFRKGVEMGAKKFIAPIFPDKYESWWKWAWKEVILPGAPLVIGAAMAILISDYPYPAPFGETASARLFLGIIAGLASGFLYPRVMFYLRKALPKKADEQALELEELRNEETE